MKLIWGICLAALLFALPAHADNLGPSVFTPLITDTFVGTDTDTQGDVFSFDFTVEVGPNGLSLLPAQWAAYWVGTFIETAPACPTTCVANLGGGAGFFPYGTPDQIPGLPATPNQVDLWSWGDFTCTEAFAILGDCSAGTTVYNFEFAGYPGTPSEYNLVANQYGAEIVGPGNSAVPEPSTWALLALGLSVFIPVKLRRLLDSAPGLTG